MRALSVTKQRGSVEQTTASRAWPGSICAAFQSAVPPVGFGEVAIMPSSRATTQRAVVGQAMPLAAEALGLSSVEVHVEAPPAGSDDV